MLQGVKKELRMRALGLELASTDVLAEDAVGESDRLLSYLAFEGQNLAREGRLGNLDIFFCRAESLSL